MWKKEDSKPQGVPEISTTPVNQSSAPGGNSKPASAPSSQPVSASPARDGFSSPQLSSKAVACISQGIKIKGEVTGSEDLFVDGQLEGKLDLGNASITIGPNSKVKADLTAREVVVRGQVDGKITARERVQLWNTGYVNGEVQTDRLAIEDGAVLRGKVEAGKLQTKSEARVASASGSSSSDVKAVGSGAAAD